MKPEKQVALINHCLPDYYTGYHRPTLQIPCTETMTNKDVADAILNEINYSFEYLTDSQNGYSENEIELFEEYAKELQTKPNDVFIEYMPEIDNDDDEFCDIPYLFFVIASPVFRYGMWFLNE